MPIITNQDSTANVLAARLGRAEPLTADVPPGQMATANTPAGRANLVDIAHRPTRSAERTATGIKPLLR